METYSSVSWIQSLHQQVQVPPISVIKQLRHFGYHFPKPIVVRRILSVKQSVRAGSFLSMIEVERREVAAGWITKHASQLAFTPQKDPELDFGLAAKSSEDFMKTVSDRVPRYRK